LRLEIGNVSLGGNDEFLHAGDALKI